MRIVLVSLNQLDKDKRTNQARCRAAIIQAIKRPCDLVIFPEMTLTGFDPSGVTAEDFKKSESLIWFKNLAKSYKKFIIFGLAIKKNKNLFNSLILVSPEGKILKQYNKIHLFKFANENKKFNPGKKIAFYRIKDLNFGFAICYDLRFPEIFALLARKSDAIIIIANWPKQRISDWKLFLKARAVENQCYVIGVNRRGKNSKGEVYPFSSMVFCPSGARQLPVFEKKAIAHHILNRNYVNRTRKKFPILQNKKFSISYR